MEFKLGGSGVTVEFCFICDAIRVCTVYMEGFCLFVAHWLNTVHVMFAK